MHRRLQRLTVTNSYKGARAQFALWREQPDLVYLDSAASCQVPDAVLERYLGYYQFEHANAHRGNYPLAQHATHLLEGARMQLADWIGGTADALIFTSSATHSLNLLANGLQLDWQAGDEIVVTRAEHHSNLLPWQRLAERHQLKLRWLDLDAETGALQDDWQVQIGPRCKLLAMTLASNVTGQLLPAAAVVAYAQSQGAITVVDAAQAVSSVPLDVGQLGCDALTFSAHKMYGVTGCGVLYATPALQTKLQPQWVGGGMVQQVSAELSRYLEGVQQFEAGTPNTAAIVACARAAQWLSAERAGGLNDYLQRLAVKLREQLNQRSWLRVLPQQQPSLPLISFYSPELHAFDLAAVLAEQNIAVRAGSHCAQPFLQALEQQAVVRVSLGAYNTAADCERLCSALDDAYQLLS